MMHYLLLFLFSALKHKQTVKNDNKQLQNVNKQENQEYLKNLRAVDGRVLVK